MEELRLHLILLDSNPSIHCLLLIFPDGSTEVLLAMKLKTFSSRARKDYF